MPQGNIISRGVRYSFFILWCPCLVRETGRGAIVIEETVGPCGVDAHDWCSKPATGQQLLKIAGCLSGVLMSWHRSRGRDMVRYRLERTGRGKKGAERKYFVTWDTWLHNLERRS